MIRIVAGAPVRPVEVVSSAVVPLVVNVVWSGTTSAVAGPSPVTKKALYEAVGNSGGASPALLPIPSRPAALLLRITERLGLRLPVNSAQVARANLDKTPGEAGYLAGETPLAEGLQALAAVNFK